MTMLFLLLIPVLAVAGYRLYLASTKVAAILREELPDAPKPAPMPASIVVDPAAYQLAGPVTIGTGAGSP